jgi:hypothetical protein
MIPGRGRFAFHIPSESVFTSLRNPYSQFPGTLIHMPRNTHCLYRHEYGQLAMKDFGLLASVVEHKKIFFREAAARYDLAKPGSLRVCPPEVHVAQIRNDYRDMREMFFTEAPPFDAVMADLRELEDRVNR